MRKDFECERDRWIGIWKKDPESMCVKQKNMKHHAAVQALSSQMMINYGVNLRHVSSEAIKPWMDLNDKKPEAAEFKLKVFMQIVKAIKEDKNPITGVPFGDESEYGLTEDVVQCIIRHTRTGRVPPKRRPCVKLWQGDINLLDMLINAVSENGYDPAVKKFAECVHARIHRGDFAPEKGKA